MPSAGRFKYPSHTGNCPACESEGWGTRRTALPDAQIVPSQTIFRKADVLLLNRCFAGLVKGLFPRTQYFALSRGFPRVELLYRRDEAADAARTVERHGY